VKGVILAGGLGSRLYPLTKITNKHLLPVYDRPMIHYPIRQLVGAGIHEIMLVTGGSFAGDFLQLLENGGEFGLKRLHYAFQKGEGGIADALKLAEDFVEDSRCVVILGDNIFENPIAPFVDAFRTQHQGARILLKEVPDPERFGVAEVDRDRIVSIEEKPDTPRSRYAVTGVYMYDSCVWEILKTLKPSRRNELEITDVNNAYLRKAQLSYDVISGWWTDAGTFDSLLRANQLVAQQQPAE
jgi:glucose-1-phosphate thymidylyltransferase